MIFFPMKITMKILLLMMLTVMFSAEAQQLKFPEDFRLSLSTIPGYKVIQDADASKSQNIEKIKDNDSLYIQRFKSGDTKTAIEIYVYQLESENMFSEKGFVDRLQLMQGYLQMLDMGAFEFLRVKNFLIQIQVVSSKTSDKKAVKMELGKLRDYYEKKSGATIFKIPAIQNSEKAIEGTYSGAKVPDYTSLRRWVSDNFDSAFYKQYIHEGSGKIILVINFDQNGKTTVKDVKGTNNEKLISAIKERIKKMPLWTTDEVSYSSTISLPLEFRNIEQ